MLVGKAAQAGSPGTGRGQGRTNPAGRAGTGWPGSIPAPALQDEGDLTPGPRTAWGEGQRVQSRLSLGGAGPARSSPPCPGCRVRRRREGGEGLGSPRSERSGNASRRRVNSGPHRVPDVCDLEQEWGRQAGRWGAWEMLGRGPPAPRVPSGLCTLQGHPRSGPLHAPASWLLLVSLAGFFVVRELYLLSATSLHSRRCRQLWGPVWSPARFCPMPGDFGCIPELLWASVSSSEQRE